LREAIISARVHFVLGLLTARRTEMDEILWEKATEVYGRLEAEMLKSFLEAEGVPVELFQEGAGQFAYASNVGALGLVQVFVPKAKLAEARQLIEAFQNPEDEIAEDGSMLEPPDDETQQ
jgi:hypothetical protein